MEEYSNWLLNDSISSHFNAFKDGFDLVMGQNHLADLFLPGELEMMVCGSNVSFKTWEGAERGSCRQDVRYTCYYTYWIDKIRKIQTTVFAALAGTQTHSN